MIAIISLASWGFAVYICYSLAKKKDMDTTSAIVWSVIFGWFAAIYYVLKEPNDGVAKQQSTKQIPETRGDVMQKEKEVKMTPNQKRLWFIGAIVIAFLTFIHWYTTRNVENIYQQVASDAVQQYEIAKRNGSKMDACVHAGIVAAAYLQAKNEMSYQQWKRIESTDCSSAGIPLLGN